MKCVSVTEAEVRYDVTQIAAGMKFLWDNKILHRDIKLSKLSLSEHDCQDRRFRAGHCRQYKNWPVRNPKLHQPRSVNGQSHPVYSELWSIGCVIYALLCGNPLFHSQSKQKTFILIKSFKIPHQDSSFS